MVLSIMVNSKPLSVFKVGKRNRKCLPSATFVPMLLNFHGKNSCFDGIQRMSRDLAMFINR